MYCMDIYRMHCHGFMSDVKCGKSLIEAIFAPRLVNSRMSVDAVIVLLLLSDHYPE